MLMVAAIRTVWVKAGDAIPSTRPAPRMTKANSPAGPRTSAVSMAVRLFRPHSRAMPNISPAFSRVSRAARPKTPTGSAATASRSRLIPTPTKNTPSSSPLNGSIEISTSRRNSVSASRRPAIRAPRLIDRPAAWAATPAPTTTSRLAAMNISCPCPLALARATDRNIGRRTSRPSTTSSARPMAAGTSVNKAGSSAAGSKSPPPAPFWASAARTVTVIRIGATARSWARRMEKVARPAVVLTRPRSAITGMTTAVDDRARPIPRTAAETSGCPMNTNTAASATVQAATWVRPRPNTSFRMALSRSHDSSSPIMNSRKATPSSDRDRIWAASEMVSQDSQGAVSARRARPSGPSSTPAARKPRTGLIFRRLNSGTTTPAAARKTTRSLYSPPSP